MERPVDRNDALPLFEQVYYRLREAIVSGRFGGEKRVPPEDELCRVFDVSRQTVRRAMAMLVEEGLIVRRRRYGTFVTSLDSAVGRQRERRQIGVIVRDMGYVAGEIVGGASAEAFARGYGTVVANLERTDLPAAEELAIGRMIDDGVGGLILWPWQGGELERHRRLEEAEIPVAIVRGKVEIAADTVNEANADGMELAVQHLYGLGHRAVGYATLDIPYFLPAFPERQRGFSRAVRRLGMVTRAQWTLRVEFREEQASIAGELVGGLRDVELPTAFCCFNDRVAAALVEALGQLGLDVPGDISVVGYDDSVLAVASRPALTSVALRKFEIGATAARLAINRIEGVRRCASDEVLIPTDLVPRQSTGVVRPESALLVKETKELQDE